MAITASAKGGGDFKPTPAGMHAAICYRILDLGTQSVEWKGKSKQQRKILVSWELHGEDNDSNPLTYEHDGKTFPLTISKKYTLSLSDNANLTADVTGWIGRQLTDAEKEAFDVSKMLSRRCMLNVVHNAYEGKTYANVASISQVPKMIRDSLPTAPTHPITEFSFETPNWEVYNALPEGIKNIIEESAEWHALHDSQPNGGSSMPDEDDDPFADSPSYDPPAANTAIDEALSRWHSTMKEKGYKTMSAEKVLEFVRDHPSVAMTDVGFVTAADIDKVAATLPSKRPPAVNPEPQTSDPLDE